MKSSREIMATLARLNEEGLLSDEDLLREEARAEIAASGFARILTEAEAAEFERSELARSLEATE